MGRARKIILIAALLIIENPQVLMAKSYFFGKLEISNIWARATPGRAATAAVYITRIHNSGEDTDSLISITSNFANKISIHKTIVDSGIAKMRQVKALEIFAGSSVSFKPGGLHIMMVGIQKSLREGDKFQLNLEFKKAGRIEVVVNVKKIGSSKMIKIDNKTRHQH
jgi:copper(I)-binding protein